MEKVNSSVAIAEKSASSISDFDIYKLKTNTAKPYKRNTSNNADDFGNTDFMKLP
jgi:hypothetical protein